MTRLAPVFYPPSRRMLRDGARRLTAPVPAVGMAEETCGERGTPMLNEVDAPTQVQPGVQEVVEKALAEERLGARDGYALMRATGSELPALLQAASLLRERHKGR